MTELSTSDHRNLKRRLKVGIMHFMTRENFTLKVLNVGIKVTKNKGKSAIILSKKEYDNFRPSDSLF